jgi:1-acyl-sn-glycerol-3-phosphate acyltransferase
LTVDQPRRLRTEARIWRTEAELIEITSAVVDVSLQVWREAENVTLSRYEPISSGRVHLARSYAAPPAPWPVLPGLVPAPDPYQNGALFHGPAFQLLKQVAIGPDHSSSILDAGQDTVPFGLLNQLLLDGAVHGIPHDDLKRWCNDVDPESLAYPYRLRRARFFAAPPRSGPVRAEVQFDGFADSRRLPVFQIQLISSPGDRGGPDGARVWATLELVEVLVPMGEQGRDRRKRVAFLRDRRFVPFVGLSEFEGQRTRLAYREVQQKDWLPGSVAAAYGVERDLDRKQLAEAVVLRDHIAQRAECHPASVQLVDRQAGAVVSGSAPTAPLNRFSVRVTSDEKQTWVDDLGPPTLDLDLLLEYGRRLLGIGPWLGEALSLALCRQFVSRVLIEDPAALTAWQGKPALYLGNHQVQVESLLFPMIASALSGTHLVTIAKAQHRQGWVGTYNEFSYRYPGVDYPRGIIYFEQRDRQSMFDILGQLRAEVVTSGHSVFLHAEGQLALHAGARVNRLSSVFIDLALELELPIIPVRFSGGLPRQPLAQQTFDFPIGYAQQDYRIGRPILPRELRSLPYGERRERVLSALNSLGPELEQEAPGQANLDLAAEVATWRRRTADREPQAVFAALLHRLRDTESEIDRLLSRRIKPRGDAREQWLHGLHRWLFAEEA